MGLPPANWDVFLDDACDFCYLYEEGEGDTAHDLSRYRHDSVLYGPTWCATPFGRGLQFDGVDDYTKAEDVSFAGRRTVVMLVCMDEPYDTDAVRGFYDFFGDSDNYTRAYKRGADFGYDIFVAWKGQGVYISTSFVYKFEKGEWFTLAVVFDTDNHLKLYINAELKAVSELTSNPMGDITGYLRVGRYIGTLYGKIAYFMAFNRPLTQDELRALHQNFRYGLACYRLIGQVINPLISDTYERVELIRKIQTNRWKIENNQLIIFDDDGVTPLKVFNLKDKYGNPSEVNVYEREPAE